MDMVQKARIKWAVEGDENSKFFHGMLNRKRHQQSIRGVMTDEAKFPKGCNSSFIALIPKIPDANMVKDFRPICLIGRGSMNRVDAWNEVVDKESRYYLDLHSFSNSETDPIKYRREKFKKKLSSLDAEIDDGHGSETLVNKRLEVINEMKKLDKFNDM
nr:RNA-directed DNA polymerase, eukaryota [Tanacetum cinerariifolium]